MKKLIKRLLLITLIAFSGFFSLIENAQAAPNAITTTQNPTLLPGYVNGTRFHIIPLTNGTITYCLNLHKTEPRSHTLYLAREMDAGVTYILENGYPKKSILGDKNKDYYITQSAIWWYLDKTTGSSNLSSAFKSGGSDDYGLRPYIKKLVTGATKAKNSGYENPTIEMNTNNQKLELTSDGKYYESQPVAIKGNNVSSKVDVELTKAPSGTEIISTSKVRKTKFKVGEKFKVRIPSSAMTKSVANIKVKATASGSYNKAYEYRPTNNALQNLVVLYPVSKNTKATIDLNVSKSVVNILKVDKTTGAPLAGATLEVKNASGKTVATWTSTTESYKISDLPNGTYTVKELKAPKGYVLNTNPVTFTITDQNKNITVKMENTVKDSLVNIIKIDKKTKSPLAGALLVLKDKDGKTITSWTSTTKAHQISKLPNGTYILKETKAPKGYKLNSEPITFTITDENKSITLEMENTPKTNVVNILKIDKMTKEPLSGATLVVKDEKGNVIARFKTTEEQYTLQDLEDGTYYVEEEEAPKGYEKSNEVISFTIDEEHDTHQITFENIAETVVPFTSTSTMMYGLGTLVLLAGIGFVYYYAKKQKA